MEQVELGIMLPGAIPFDDQNRNATWKAHIKTHNNVIRVVYVKKLSFRSLFVECLCAILGRSLGLPIPKPYIVLITNKAVEFVPENEKWYGFGSEDAEYPSFRRFVTENKDILEKLKKFKKILDVAIFDEWIANFDRNWGNILYDGEDDFIFIDHENSLRENLKPDTPVSNMIIKYLYSDISEFEKYKIKKDVNTIFAPMYKKVPYLLIADKTFAITYLDEDEVVSIIDFLEKRVEHLVSLIESRLGMKQRKLAAAI